MADETPPPPMGEQDLKEMVQAIMQDPGFAERGLEYASRRDRLYGLNKISIPGLTNLQATYHWPRLRKDANAFKNRLLNAPAEFGVAAQSDAPMAIKKAQKMKNYAARQYGRWRELGCFDGAAFDMVAMGRGELHLFVNRDVLPIIPEPQDGDDPKAYIKNAEQLLADFGKGKRQDLIGIESVLAETVYWTADKSVKFMAAEIPLNPLIKAYRDLKDDDRGVAVSTLLGGIAKESAMSVYNKTVTIYVVEDADYIYHLVFTKNMADANTGVVYVDGGELLGTFKNPFGMPAFVPLEAERTGDPRPLWSALPLIDGLYEVGPLVNIMGSLIVSGGVEAVQNQETLENLPGAEAQSDREDVDPNDIEVRQLDDKFRIAPPGMRIAPSGYKLPADVLTAYTALQKEAQGYGYPMALGQPQDIQAKSGYDRALVQEPVSAALDPPLEHIGDAINIITRASFAAHKAFNVPATIRNLTPSKELGAVHQDVQDEITLEPDDIIDVDTSVSFSSITKATQIADQEEAMKMLDLGLMFKDEFLMEHRGVQDLERYYDRATISDMRAIANKAIQTDAAAAFQAIRAFVQQKAIEAAKLKPPMADAAKDALANGAEPTDGTPAGDQPPPTSEPVTPSIPTGTGSAMAITPPLPQGGAPMA